MTFEHYAETALIEVSRLQRLAFNQHGDTTMKPQESYWAYKAPPTPELADLPEGAFKGDERAWHSLSPGMRREIMRYALRRTAAANAS